MTRPLPLVGALRGNIHDLNADRRWTGEELTQETLRRARSLSQIDGTQGGVFAVLHANSLEFFADLFAIWQAGGVAACLNPGLTDEELRNVLAHITPVAILTAERDVPFTEIPLMNLSRDRAKGRDMPGMAAGLDDPALVLFTSGTTGDPKGVTLTHRALLARLALNRAEIGANVLSRSLSVLPTHFGHGLIGNALTPLSAGGSLWLMPDAGLAGAARLSQIIDTNAISFMSSVPSYWKMALRVSDVPAQDTLKRVHIGSAPLSGDLWTEIANWAQGAACVNAYGITETSNWIGGASSTEFTPEDGLIGRLWGGHAAVRSEAGVASQGEGEIMIQSPSLMAGYLGRPDLTQEVLEGGWYATGDLGTIDAHGVLRMTGRAKHMINRGGMKIYPEEFDLLLERHPNVVEACAFATPDPISGEAMEIALVAAAGQKIDQSAVMAWLKDQVRQEAMPARLHVLDTIPKTSRGKINRADVAAHCAAQTGG